MTKLTEILEECQKSFGYHKKGIAKLRKLLKTNPKAFQNEFYTHLKQILVVFKREPAAERLIQFIINLATQFEDDKERKDPSNYDFAFSLINHLMGYLEAQDKAVRFRSLQLLSGIVNNMNEDIEIE